MINVIDSCMNTKVPKGLSRHRLGCVEIIASYGNILNYQPEPSFLIGLCRLNFSASLGKASGDVRAECVAKCLNVQRGLRKPYIHSARLMILTSENLPNILRSGKYLICPLSTPRIKSSRPPKNMAKLSAE